MGGTRPVRAPRQLRPAGQARDGNPVLRMTALSAAVLVLASLVGVTGFGWPFLSDPGNGESSIAPYFFVVLLPLVVALVGAELASDRIDAKAVAMLGVLAAAGAALRALSPGTAGFEPTLFLLVVAGRVYGAGFGFVLGPVLMLASALVTGGIGPWLPYQMVGLAWVGLFAGCLPRALAGGRGERGLLAAYAAIAAFGYGALLNLSFWPFGATLPAGMAYVAADPPLANLGHYAAFYVTTSLGWDCVRALVNAALVLVAGRPVLATLRRAARRAAFGAPVGFEATS